MDEDQGSLIGNAQELITGAVVLIVSYVIYQLMNGPLPKIFRTGGKVVDHGLNAINAMLDHPLLSALGLALAGLFGYKVLRPAWIKDQINMKASIKKIELQAERDAKDASLTPEEKEIRRLQHEKAKGKLQNELREQDTAIKNNQAISKAENRVEVGQQNVQLEGENPALHDILNTAGPKDYADFLSLAADKNMDLATANFDGISGEPRMNSKVIQALEKAKANPSHESIVRNTIDLYLKQNIGGQGTMDLKSFEGTSVAFMGEQPVAATLLNHLSKFKGDLADMARQNMGAKNPQDTNDVVVKEFQNKFNELLNKDITGMTPEERKAIEEINNKIHEEGKPGERPSEEGKGEKPAGEHPVEA